MSLIPLQLEVKSATTFLDWVNDGRSQIGSDKLPIRISAFQDHKCYSCEEKVMNQRAGKSSNKVQWVWTLQRHDWQPECTALTTFGEQPREGR